MLKNRSTLYKDVLLFVQNKALKSIDICWNFYWPFIDPSVTWLCQMGVKNNQIKTVLQEPDLRQVWGYIYLVI